MVAGVEGRRAHDRCIYVLDPCLEQVGESDESEEWACSW